MIKKYLKIKFNKEYPIKHISILLSILLSLANFLTFYNLYKVLQFLSLIKLITPNLSIHYHLKIKTNSYINL